jgi:hypothetical protein
VPEAEVLADHHGRRVQPGQAINVFFTRPNGSQRLSGVAFRSEPGASITASRTEGGAFISRQVSMPVSFEIARISQPVERGLYATALRYGDVLVTEGLFRDRVELTNYIAELRALQSAPDDQRLTWRHGLGVAMRDPSVKLAEIGNWLQSQVLPVR